MLEVAKLFVKSVKVPIGSMETHDIPGHYCQNAYRTQSTMISQSTEDKRAKEILSISHVTFELVDLADGKGANKVAAWLGHVKTTPTLIVPASPNKKYEGISAISDFVRSQALLGRASSIQLVDRTDLQTFVTSFCDPRAVSRILE